MGRTGENEISGGNQQSNSDKRSMAYDKNGNTQKETVIKEVAPSNLAYSRSDQLTNSDYANNFSGRNQGEPELSKMES